MHTAHEKHIPKILNTIRFRMKVALTHSETEVVTTTCKEKCRRADGCGKKGQRPSLVLICQSTKHTDCKPTEGGGTYNTDRCRLKIFWLKTKANYALFGSGSLTISPR